MSKSLTKSGSLPSIVNGRPSPFFQKQALCEVQIRSRKITRQAVGDHEGQGKPGQHGLKLLSKKKMGFCAAERGLEWERGEAKAQIPPDPLPSIPEVIKMAMREFDLEFPPTAKSLKSVSSSNLSRRDPSFGGSGLHRCGPKLPLNKMRPELDLNTPPPSPPRAKKEPKKKKKKEPEKDAKTVAFAESMAQKLAQTQSDEPEEVEVCETHLQEERLMDIPWSEEELRMVFYKFDSDRDNELEVEDLVPLLRYLGAKPDPKAISKIILELTHYATIEWEEFLEFIRRFREYDINLLRQSFKAADKDGEGKLDAVEVEALMRKLNYAPTAQTVFEAMDAVDKDNDGDLDFYEFEELRDYLRKTEGFFQKDLEELQQLYVKAAGGEKRDLNTDEIWRITMFLGYANTAQEIAQIVAEVDADGSGTIDFPELLKVVRRVRDIEKESIIRVLRSHGEICGSRILMKDLGRALNDLGYYVAEDAVNEILESLGEYESEEYLTLDELLAFLRGYRETEGFSKEELKELEHAFYTEDKDGTNAINALELGRILRGFGFPKTLQAVQRLVEQIDFDGSGELEMNEFLKLMRQLFQLESKKRLDVFHSLDTSRSGKVDVDLLPTAIFLLDEMNPEQTVLESSLVATVPQGSTTITAKIFDLFYKHYRRAVVEEIRKNAGYGPKEIIQLNAIFSEYDKDQSGTIEHTELQKLIAQYFPDATKSRAQQIEIQKILQGFGASNMTGELDFHNFIWLMRKCDDMRDEADVYMEAEVIKQCSLSVEEVEGFRQIFSAVVSWTGELESWELSDLLTKVVELTEEEVEELGNVIQSIHPHGRQVARFPQFLKLIKRITDDNLLGVNESANKILRREQARKQRKETGQMDTAQRKKVEKEAKKHDSEHVE